MGKVLITPDNWESGGVALLQKKWIIKYRFYDDNTGQVKQVSLSDFNRYKKLEERRDQLKGALAFELNRLKNNGWNPITKKYKVPIQVAKKGIVNKYMTFEDAMKYASSKMNVAENTRTSETDFYLNQIIAAASNLGFAHDPSESITRRHIREICDAVSIKQDSSISEDKFNRCKKVLKGFYDELLDAECVEANIPYSIKGQKLPPPKKKLPITLAERQKIYEYLSSRKTKKKIAKRFLLFLQIFFHSGSRGTELLKVKRSDVDLLAQDIDYIILKGNKPMIKKRPLLDIDLELWREACSGVGDDEYIFGVGLMPSVKKASRNSVKLLWQRMAKKLGIKKGMYQLKHTHTTQVRKLQGSRAASILNAESEEMISKHYDLELEHDDNEELKKIRIPFC